MLAPAGKHRSASPSAQALGAPSCPARVNGATPSDPVCPGAAHRRCAPVSHRCLALAGWRKCWRIGTETA